MLFVYDNQWINSYLISDEGGASGWRRRGDRTFARTPWEKDIDLAAVSLPLRVALVLLLQQGHARQESYQVRDKHWCPDSDPAPLNTARNKPDTPPEDSLSEVVGMSRESPETFIDKLFLAWGLVGDMALELLVTHDLKDEAKKPDSRTDIVQPDQTFFN